ncbi:MAG: antitoxin [Candidatus Omnitrophica bacterium]|nr:antitoxin [Candidatus Omnitrophota bacterium]
MRQLKLTKDEQDILRSYERGEWRPVKNMQAEMLRFKEMAKRSLRKGRRINIRLSEQDVHRLQISALREGMPYQTLIASVLHKYVSGRLMPR